MNLRAARTVQIVALIASLLGVACSSNDSPSAPSTTAIAHGSPYHLVFSLQPADTPKNGEIAVTVQVLDNADDSLDTEAVGDIDIAIGVNPGNGTLNGTKTIAVMNGYAGTADLGINKAGTGYTLIASSSLAPSVESDPFDILSPADHLVFSQQPTNAAAGAAITPAVQVQALDIDGDLDATFTGNIAVAIDSNPGTATLGGTLQVAAVNGVATFADLSLDNFGTGYTLVTSSAGLASATSDPFDVGAGAATHLVFTQQPSNIASGSAISPAVTVTALDAADKVATSFNGSVALAFVANPGGAALTNGSATAANGVATFTGLTVDKAGSYMLSATSGALTPATSMTFDVTAGAATKLVFAQQPTSTTAGVTIAPAVVVNATDDAGNVDTTFNGTVALSPPPVQSGTLMGTTSVTAMNGVATFSDLDIEFADSYQLSAAASGLANATSDVFTISPAAFAGLQFVVQPTSQTAGVAISTIQVAARDSFGNATPAFVGPITLSRMTGPATATLSGTLTQNAASGVATFSGISIDKAGTFTLAATSGAITTQSSSFIISPAAASTLAFTVQPSNAVSGAPISPAVQVTASDAFGNVAAFTGPITLTAIGPSALGGTTMVNAIAGVATFSNLSLATAGMYTLSASGAGTATSGSFTISAAAATALAISQQPTTTAAGGVIMPAITVRAVDGSGNTNTTFTGAVTASIATGPTGATLGGTVTVNAIAGVATFSTLTLDRAGPYTLQFASSGLASATSASFTVTAGTAATLAFAQQPTSAVAGSAIAPPVTVEVRDSLGNVVTSFNGGVSIAFGTNPTTAALAGTTTVNAMNGVATFSTLSVNLVGTGYTLVATSPSLTSATSSPFAIAAGTAVALTYSTQPSDVAAGSPIMPAITVTARDAQGNIATGFIGNVVLALGANPGTATLGGTLTHTAAAGVATFANITVDKVGADYTLVATTTGLPAVTSDAFDVTSGAATQLAITVQPTTTAAGQAIVPAVVVQARDANGNVATQFTGPITIALGTNPGSATLGGTVTVNAVAGIATLSTLSINLAGTGYTLVASATGLSDATSSAFDIVAADANHLVVDVQPTDAVAGVAVAPAIVITAHDMNGNLDTTFTGAVTLVLSNNPGSATLMGTITANAVAGEVTFADIALDKVGTGYTLTASSTGVVSAATDAFAITPAPVDHIVFGQQPVNGVAGAALAAVRVDAFDEFENLATQFTGPFSIALGTNTTGATLGGTLTVNAVAGRATFSTLTVDRTGSYSLVASGAADPVTSSVFAISPAAASALAFTVQPASIAAGAFIAPAIVVEARDALGNVDTTFTGSVTLAIGTNPGTSTLAGTTTVNAIAGVATFSDITLDKVGTGYTLVASATGLTMATSTAFDVTPGSANSLAFSVQPSDAASGAAIAPPVKVSVRDASNNVVTSFNGNVIIAFATNTTGATLSGTTTMAAVAGVATFSDLAVDKAGTYTLGATSTGLTSATSDSFVIGAGAATALVAVQQPSNAASGSPITPAVQIAAVDASGNRVTTFTGDITIALANNPSTAVLGGTLTVAAVAGVASFSTLTVDRAGTGYTLTASSTGLTSVTTTAFDIVAATSTHLAFVVEPSDVVAGTAITPAITVRALDAQNNVDTSFTGSVTIAIGTNANGGTLMGTAMVNAVAGVATFSDLSLDKAGTGYTLAASSGALTGVTSPPFDVAPGAAAAYTANLSANVNAGEAVTLSLKAVDSFGNIVTSYTGTATITSSDGASTHPASVTFASGTATASITFNTAGSQTLTLTDGALTATFTTNVVAGGDTMATAVRIVSPHQGDPVGGKVLIQAEGTLATGTTLASFEVLVDGVAIGTATSLPAEIEWDTSELSAPASHVITARLKDSAGTTVEAEPITVSIAVIDNGFGCDASNGHGTLLFLGLALLALTRWRRRR
jgi:hypothetical protein